MCIPRGYWVASRALCACKVVADTLAPVIHIAAAHAAAAEHECACCQGLLLGIWCAAVHNALPNVLVAFVCCCNLAWHRRVALKQLCLVIFRLLSNSNPLLSNTEQPDQHRPHTSCLVRSQHLQHTSCDSHAPLSVLCTVSLISLYTSALRFGRPLIRLRLKYVGA